jgi:hypothetical protein
VLITKDFINSLYITDYQICLKDTLKIKSAFYVIYIKIINMFVGEFETRIINACEQEAGK